MLDAIVVGAGPNGLAAAIELARAGLGVRIYEADSTAGGGTRSAELTLPGFIHDPCSAVHSLRRRLAVLSVPRPRSGTASSSCCRRRRSRTCSTPDHAVMLERSIDATAAGLGRDGAAWRRLFGPLVQDIDRTIPSILRPVGPPAPPSDRAGPVRRPGAAAGDGTREDRVPRAGRPRPLRRPFLPLDGRPRTPDDGVLRSRPRDAARTAPAFRSCAAAAAGSPTR